MPRIIVGGSIAALDAARAPPAASASRPARTARKLTALIAKQTPTPQAAITTPASAGPTTREALKRLAFSATAFGSSSRPTIWKVSAWRPGASKTIAVLESAAST